MSFLPNASDHANPGAYSLADLQEIFEDMVERISEHDETNLPDHESIKPATLAMLLIAYTSDIHDMLMLLENYALYRYSGPNLQKIMLEFDAFAELLVAKKARFNQYWRDVFDNLHLRCFEQPDADGKLWFIYAAFCARPLPGEPSLPVLWAEKAKSEYDAHVDERALEALRRVYALLGRGNLSGRFLPEFVRALVHFEWEIGPVLLPKTCLAPTLGVGKPITLRQKRQLEKPDAAIETEDKENDADSERSAVVKTPVTSNDDDMVEWGEEDGEYEVDEEFEHCSQCEK